MGGYETRDSNVPKELLPIPQPGPTLIDFYFHDTDRHASGQNCFEYDHYRGLTDQDQDVNGLQHRQDPSDHLTDSESDDDEAYTAPKPSMTRIKNLLNGDADGTVAVAVPSDDKKTAAKEATSPDGASTNEMYLEDDDRNSEQVELLRDRKILEMESYLLKLRQKDADVIADRYRIWVLYISILYRWLGLVYIHL